MSSLCWRVLLLAVLAIVPLGAQKPPDVASAAAGLTLRGIGPALHGGRISDIAVHPTDAGHLVRGGRLRAASGRPPTPAPPGRRSSTTSRRTPSVRSRSTPRNPEVVWVGTGENVSGRHVGWGDGVYRSRDAGRTWQRMGLPQSQHIGRILVDPRDGDVVLVAAEGPLWSAGGERGVYRTTDGGATWAPVLQIDENTGVTDLEFDPANPDVVYAAAYERRRHVWGFLAGGPRSGIWKSTDNGKTLAAGHHRAAEGRHGEDRPRRHAGRPESGVRHDRSGRGRARLLPLARPGRELGAAQPTTSPAAPARTTTRRSRPRRPTPTWSTRWTCSSR